MKIRHKESSVFFDIRQDGDSTLLVDSRTNRVHSFREAYEAIWYAIESTRMISYDALSPARLVEIAKKAHLSPDLISASTVGLLKKEKPIRTYYDQTFLKILSLYRAGAGEIELSNSTNFVIDHEVAAILRTISGLRFTMPAP